MSIKCVGCGESVIFAKMFGGAWSQRIAIEDINRFFDEHLVCRDREKNGEHDFSLEYEV
jgi:hypothetical protein